MNDNYTSFDVHMISIFLKPYLMKLKLFHLKQIDFFFKSPKAKVVPNIIGRNSMESRFMSVNLVEHGRISR